MATASHNHPALQSAPSLTELVDFLTDSDSPQNRTLYVGNLDARVSRAVLYELMLQAGPVTSVKIVPPRENTAKTIAFVQFEHAVSVRYAMLAFSDIPLYRCRLSLNYSGSNKRFNRPDYPPKPPTFFEMPSGFEQVSQATKDALTAAAAVPPAAYNTGYYTGPATVDSERAEYEDRDARSSHQSMEGGPPAKRRHWDQEQPDRHDSRHQNCEQFSPPVAHVHSAALYGRQATDMRGSDLSNAHSHRNQYPEMGLERGPSCVRPPPLRYPPHAMPAIPPNQYFIPRFGGQQQPPPPPSVDNRQYYRPPPPNRSYAHQIPPQQQWHR